MPLQRNVYLGSYLGRSLLVVVRMIRSAGAMIIWHCSCGWMRRGLVIGGV